MIIQCPACRALVTVHQAVAKAGGAEVGLACPECKATAWLPLHDGEVRHEAPPREEAPKDAELASALENLPPFEGQSAPLSADFEALLCRWDDYEAHRALIRKAQALDALPAVGLRYRAVLEVRPTDAVALRAREEILALAMATLPKPDAKGEVDEWRRYKLMAAVAAWAVAGLLIWYLTYLVRDL